MKNLRCYRRTPIVALVACFQITWSSAGRAQESAPHVSASQTTTVPPIKDGQVTVCFQSDQPDVRLLMHDEEEGEEFPADHFSEVCTAPCETTMPEGKHRMALSQGSSHRVEVSPIELRSPSTIRGTYHSLRSVRLGLGMVAAALGIGGIVAMYAGVQTESHCSNVPGYTTICVTTSADDHGLIYGGAIAAGIAIGLAIAVWVMPKAAGKIVVMPLESLLVTTRAAKEGAIVPNNASGIGLQMKF